MPLNVQCKRCVNLRNDWCDKKHDSPAPELVRDCQYYRAATNADRIRAMTDEELAAWLRVVTACEGCPAVENFDDCRHGKDCEEKWLEWLRREAT